MTHTALSAEAKKIADAVTFRSKEWKNPSPEEWAELTDGRYKDVQCRYGLDAAKMQAGGRIC